MSSDIQWKVQYEDSLIQPVREVLDINMGEYASGTRQYNLVIAIKYESTLCSVYDLLIEMY